MRENTKGNNFISYNWENKDCVICPKSDMRCGTQIKINLNTVIMDSIVWSV